MQISLFDGFGLPWLAMSSDSDVAGLSVSDAQAGGEPDTPERPRTLSVALDNIDEGWEGDERLGALWRSARLGPTVERLRRHVLQGGAESIEAGQFRALDSVAANQPCAVRALAAVMGLEPSSVTRALNKLESNGLIRKRRAEHDHREVLVELTAEGERTHGFFVDRAHAIYQDIFVVFSVEERLLLADLLERMLKSTDATLATVAEKPKR